jgi:hypothetical protein
MLRQGKQPLLQRKQIAAGDEKEHTVEDRIFHGVFFCADGLPCKA